MLPPAVAPNRRTPAATPTNLTTHTEGISCATF